MHEEEDDDLCDGDPDMVLGRVRDIRRKWAVQEDEALAYRLQDEEIAQHYNSNRTRNAIVREDAPRAREAQRQEELQALEERLKHLNILQKQAEEDARIAKLLASKDAEKAKKHSPTSNGKSKESSPVLTPLPKLSPPELMQQVVQEVIVSKELRQTKSPSLGARARVASASTSSSSCEEPGPSRSRYGSPDSEDVFTEEDLRKAQEERDAAVARALQEELDRLEKDKVLALEAQDRELAKMLHEKERARYRRAKEKARLKAEQMAAMAERGETPDSCTSEGVRVASRNSTSSERSSRSATEPLLSSPPPPLLSTAAALAPKLPEKQRSPTGDQIGFRAHPKPLPPHPPATTPELSSLSPSPQHHRIEQHHNIHHLSQRMPLDPVPPYMPIHGYNRNSPKRSK